MAVLLELGELEGGSPARFAGLVCFVFFLAGWCDVGRWPKCSGGGLPISEHGLQHMFDRKFWEGHRHAGQGLKRLSHVFVRA